MNTIRVTRKQYWKAAGKNCLETLIIVILFGILMLALFHWKYKEVVFPATMFILFKLVDMLTKFHVDELVLNDDKQVVQIHLSSIFSGEKNIQFPLNGLTTSLKHQTGLKSIFSGSIILLLWDANGNQFRITTRYGFSPADLEQFHAWLQSSTSPIVTA